MGLHFRHLAENPEHQRRLREDPAFLKNGLEELLRAFGATSTFRTCIKEQKINGVTIKQGDRVLIERKNDTQGEQVYVRVDLGGNRRMNKNVDTTITIIRSVGRILRTYWI